MKTSELLQQIDQRFSEKLEAKTGWGRNEVKFALQSVIIEILAEITEKVIENE